LEEEAAIKAEVGDEVKLNDQEDGSNADKDESNDDGDWPEKVCFLFFISVNLLTFVV
jgi:hypothetical protein